MTHDMFQPEITVKYTQQDIWQDVSRQKEYFMFSEEKSSPSFFGILRGWLGIGQSKADSKLKVKEKRGRERNIFVHP